MSASAPGSPVQSESPLEGYSSPPGKRTRTVAIVKNHALDHRFDIESRMLEAGFEVRSSFALSIEMLIWSMVFRLCHGTFVDRQREADGIRDRK